MEKTYETRSGNTEKAKIHVLIPLIATMAVGIFACLCTLCLMALFLSKFEILPLVPALSVIVIAVGAGTSAVLIAKTFREDKLFMCAASGVIWVILLVLLNVIFFREHMTAMSAIRFGTAFLVPICLSFCVRLTPRTKRHSGNKHKK